MVNALYVCANVTHGFSPFAYTETFWDVLEVSLLIKIHFYVYECLPGCMYVQHMCDG